MSSPWVITNITTNIMATFQIYNLNNELISHTTDEIKELFANGQLNLGENQYTYFNFGVYYFLEKNYELAIKYYLMAIELGNSEAMNNLGYYYHFIEKNYDKMFEYYLMAIDLGNSNAMNNLGHYYHYTKENYDLAKKYYLMAIDLGNSQAMINIGYYYHYIEQNYDLMKKYYLIAIDLGRSDTMNNLGYYYHCVEKNYDLAKKYYLMAIKLGKSVAISNIKYITTPLERYILFKNNGIKFDEDITRDITIYENKLKMSKVEKCGICLEENVNVILLNCFFHSCCCNCYYKVYKDVCPFCKL
jgi:tetratricopeptide (TPR) repeat protein